MLTGVRTVELHQAEWKEFDFDKRVWEVPDELLQQQSSRRYLCGHDSQIC